MPSLILNSASVDNPFGSESIVTNIGTTYFRKLTFTQNRGLFRNAIKRQQEGSACSVGLLLAPV